MGRGRLRALALLLLLLATSNPRAEASDGLRALLVAYRCPVVDRLDRIYEHGDRASDRDRFLAITVSEHRDGYVQCIFQDKGTKLLCEASSGFFTSRAGAPRTFQLKPAAIEALAGLGFSTDDSEGNFQLMLDVSSPPDFNRFADLMLTALHLGYGVQAGARLEFSAPFARRPTSKCIPLG